MNEKIDQLEIDLDLTTKKATKVHELYLAEQEQKLDLESELKECKKRLDKCNKILQELQEKHNIAISTLKEKEFIISNLLNSENSILEQAKELRANLQNASDDITMLFTEIDRKANMERENHGLVLSFGSQLDQSLKTLHRTVLGSVSQQEQHLRCMEEHVCSFLASKCDANKILESRIEKIKDTYSSGVHAMKVLAGMLHKESSSNLMLIKSMVLAQTNDVENFLLSAAKEAEDIILDIHYSLDEQKQLLAFSAQQQEEGLKRSLVSAQVISKETIEFFGDLYGRLSTLTHSIQEDQREKSQRLAAFGKTFQEESSNEEKLALEKIAVILSTLTSKKTEMVSKTLRNMDEENNEAKGRLQQEIFDVQKISSNAKREWNGYLDKVQSHFVENTFSAAESRATMENTIQECSERAEDCRKHWKHANLCIDHLNKSSFINIGSIVEETIHEIDDTLEEIKCLSALTSVESDARASDLLEIANNSLQMDHETTKEIESMCTMCLSQIKFLQERHGENISNIRNRADQCLIKEYLVDSFGCTPAKEAITVPSLASIEELRTPALEDLVAKMKSFNGTKGGNQQNLSPDRTPFTPVN